MIAPVSSWAAAVSGVAADLDTGVSGIELFIQAIPYNFYSLAPMKSPALSVPPQASTPKKPPT